ALGRLLAQDLQPYRRVADQRADVDRRAARLERVQELGEALERPLPPDAGEERLQGHALDALPRAQDELTVCRPGRRDAQAAVAHHQRRDAVPGRDRQHAIPEHLGVVVRVDVDEAGSDDGALGVDGARGAAGHVADRRDATVAHGDVAAPARRARAVDQRAAADQEIVVLAHGPLFSFSVDLLSWAAARRSPTHRARAAGCRG